MDIVYSERWWTVNQQEYTRVLGELSERAWKTAWEIKGAIR